MSIPVCDCSLFLVPDSTRLAGEISICRSVAGAGTDGSSITLKGRENDSIAGLCCLSRFETTRGIRPIDARRLGRESSGLLSCS